MSTSYSKKPEAWSSWRKEADFVSEDGSAHLYVPTVDPKELRRRRVYENQFKRPYPSKQRKARGVASDFSVPLLPRKPAGHSRRKSAGDAFPSPRLNPENAVTEKSGLVDLSEIAQASDDSGFILNGLKVIPSECSDDVVQYNVGSPAPDVIGVASSTDDSNVSTLSSPTPQRNETSRNEPSRAELPRTVRQHAQPLKSRSVNAPARQKATKMKKSQRTAEIESLEGYLEQENKTADPNDQDEIAEHGNHTMKLYIDDYQESTFDKIVESFYGNANIRTLAICRSWQASAGTAINYKTKQEMRWLFEAIRCLPKLHTLLLLNMGEDALNILTEQLPKKISKLQLHLAEGTTEIPDALLDALGEKLPNLQQIQLEVNGSFDVGRLVKGASQLNMLKVVSAERWDWQAEHIQSLGAALAEQVPGTLDDIRDMETQSLNVMKSKLMVLDLQPNLPLSSFQSLLSSLHNNKSLQSLRVTVHPQSDSDAAAAADDAAWALSKFLHANSTLTHLYNHKQVKFRLPGLIKNPCVNADATSTKEAAASTMLVEALQQNETMEVFSFFREEPVFWMAKEAVLKRNKQRKRGDTCDNLADLGISMSTADLSDMMQQYLSCGPTTDGDEKEKVNMMSWLSFPMDLFGVK